jgi:hypothetical protein
MNHTLINDPVAAALNGQQIEMQTEEFVEDPDFSYDGFQVVRGEFFAHIYEPSITFNNCKVSLNTACIRKLPEVEYVQILVNPETMKLAVRPRKEDDKDSFLWCNSKNGKRKPKQITCRLFFAKLVSLMGWNPNYRYKLLGKIIRSGDEFLILFDLKATEMYQRTVKDDGKIRTSRIPTFPAEWQDQFGLPYHEHRQSLQINIFDGYAVFAVNQNGEVESEGKEVPPEGSSNGGDTE